MARTRQPWAGQSLWPPGHPLGLAKVIPGAGQADLTPWDQGDLRTSEGLGRDTVRGDNGPEQWRLWEVGAQGVVYHEILLKAVYHMCQPGVSGDLREVLVDSVSLACSWLWRSPPFLVLQEAHLGYAFYRFGTEWTVSQGRLKLHSTQHGPSSPMGFNTSPCFLYCFPGPLSCLFPPLSSMPPLHFIQIKFRDHHLFL